MHHDTPPAAAAAPAQSPVWLSDSFRTYTFGHSTECSGVLSSNYYPAPRSERNYSMTDGTRLDFNYTITLNPYKIP